MKRSVLAAAVALSTSCFWGNSCVARGSWVETPNGRRRIEDLRVGDVVYAFDEGTGERFETPIVLIRSAMREVGCLEVAGQSLRLTSDHPTFCPVDRVYAPAGDWFLGRRTALAVLAEDGLQTREVEGVRAFVEVTEVFDIGVAHERHNFVADGVLVHNKSYVQECQVNNATYVDGQSCVCADNSEGWFECATGECRCDPTVNNSASDASMDDTSADLDLAGDASTSPDVSSSDAADAAEMGAIRHRGLCTTDADCAQFDGTCITIGADGPAGYHTCQVDEAAPPNCGEIQPPDTCCVHADCNQEDPSGTCVVGPIFYCGGVAPVIANVCMVDACASDSECGADELCLPPRVLAEPVARCVPAPCKVDADCDSRAGGQCTEFFSPCNGRLAGFFCTYDDSLCRVNADCPDDPGGPSYCVPDPAMEGATACEVFVPPP